MGIKAHSRVLTIITGFFTALILLLPTSQLQANELDLEQHKGKVIYLDFWASWCGPCRQSFPFMNDLKAKYEEQGLIVLSINVDEVAADAEKFLAKYPADFEVIYDQHGKIANEFQLKAMPTSFLFNRDGKKVGSHLGFKNKDIEKLTLEIVTLLEQR